MQVKLVLALVVVIVAGGIVRAEKQPFDRYQPILDRQMFGQLPPGFDPTKPPSEVTKASQKELTKEQEQLKSAIHFSVINITPDGATAVGFTDNSDPKAPVHYYLKVGEKRNGWEVQEADPQTATMTIAKGEIVVSLELGANSAKTAGATSAAKPAASGARPNLLGNRSAAAATPSTSRLDGLRAGGGFGSLRERRAQREAERAKAAEEAAAKAKAEEEKRKAEQEANRLELQSLKDELRAQREAAERERQERERKEQEDRERREREAQESAEKSENAENDA